MAKDILKSSITYTVLGFLPLSFSFLFTPIYLKYLDAEEYGLLNLFMLYGGFLAQLFNLGISTAFGYLYWDFYKDQKALNRLISTTILSIVMIQLFFMLVLFIGGDFIFKEVLNADESIANSQILALLCIFSAFSVFYELFLYLFRNEDKLKSYSALSVLTLVLLTVGTLITVVVLDWKAIGAMMGRTAAYLLVVLVFFLLILRRSGISFDLSISKNLLKFGFPIFINGIIGAVVFGADRLFIERNSDLESLGIYGFALVIVTVIEVWFNALNNAVSPTLYRLMNESFEDKSKEIKGLTDLIIISVLIVISLINAVFLPVLDLIFPEEYRSASLIVPILSIAFIWRALSTLNTYSIYLRKRTKYLVFNQLTNLLVFLLLVYPLFKLFDLSGIAIAVLLARFADFLIIKFISNKLKRLPFEMKKYGLIALLLSALVIVNNQLDQDGYNAYLLNLTPLILVLISCISVLRKNTRQLKNIIKNRKELFKAS